MSETLQTKEHGGITSGFLGSHMKEVIIGDYTYPIEKFCKMAAFALKRLAAKKKVGEDSGSIKIRKYTIALEDFCALSEIVLGGGFYGWNGPAPACVQKAIESCRAVS